MFSFLSETRELNEKARRSTGGSYAQLPEGVTHYELGNPTQHQTVVLVHGFSVPYFIFDPTFYFLTEHGFRVLRYDLFGRGYSDRPDGHYNIRFFTKQLEDLLEALGLTQPISLAGLSMGGPITAAFTERHPERVHKLILIDPAGARPVPLSRLLKFAATPVIGEVILSLVGSGGMIKSFASDFFDRKIVAHFLDQYMVQMKYKGFRRAILSTIRNNMLNSFIDSYQKVGLLHIPVLLIWGRHDSTVPLSHSEDLRAAISHIEFHIIEDSTHIPHFEKPEVTNPLLLEFLRRP